MVSGQSTSAKGTNLFASSTWNDGERVAACVRGSTVGSKGGIIQDKCIKIQTDLTDSFRMKLTLRSLFINKYGWLCVRTFANRVDFVGAGFRIGSERAGIVIVSDVSNVLIDVAATSFQGNNATNAKTRSTIAINGA